MKKQLSRIQASCIKIKLVLAVETANLLGVPFLFGNVDIPMKEILIKMRSLQGLMYLSEDIMLEYIF